MPVRLCNGTALDPTTTSPSSANEACKITDHDQEWNPLCNSCKQFFYGTPKTWTTDHIQQFETLFNSEEGRPGVYRGEITVEEMMLAKDCYHSTDLQSILVAWRDWTCHFCTIICTGFLDDLEFKDDFASIQQRFLAGEHFGYKVRIALGKILDFDRFAHTILVDITMNDIKQQAWVSCGIVASSQVDLNLTGQPMASSTSSEASSNLASTWLSTCLEHHTNCQQLKGKSGILPARLLNLANIARTGQVTLSTTSAMNQAYLTTSHCWGTTDRLTLTKQNLREFQTGIAINRLALTFQHAIEIARRLGYYRLWIDCLCIIQDSIEDWEVESSKMADIYGNSVCCIAASASTGSEGGCYRERNPLEVQALRLKSSIFPNIPAFEGSESFLIAQGDVIRGSKLFDGPLDKRGWILQEQILAPRTLHYTQRQIFWECRKLLASEVWPAGVPDDMGYQLLDNKSKKMFDIHQTLPREQWDIRHENGQGLLHRRWESLLEMYTKRALTKSYDKLPALSGMVDVMLSLTNDEYLAGLWRSDFVCGLCWRAELVVRKKTLSPRPVAYRAPSWSWASVDDAIEFHENGTKHTHTMQCTIHNISVDYADKSLTGRVRGGKLIVSGLSRRTVWIKDKGRRGRMRFADEQLDWLNSSAARVYPDFESAEMCSNILLFQVFGSEYHPATFPTDKLIYMGGLILESTNATENEYCRIGYLNYWTQILTEQQAPWENTEGWHHERITII